MTESRGDKFPEDGGVAHASRENFGADKTQTMAGTKHPDVDGGWAWLVAIGMAGFYFIIGGFFRSFGVVFAAILEKFDESASLTSLVPGVRAACLIIIGPASTALSQRLTERVVIVIGSLIVSTGFIISFFSTNLEFLIFSIGMMPGMGASLIVGPANIVLGKYFSKRRARAVTMTSSVGCVGQIIVPLIMVKLIEEYSVQGSLLIYGGVCLNVILTGLIMKPINLPEDKDQVKRNEEKDEIPQISSIKEPLERDLSLAAEEEVLLNGAHRPDNVNTRNNFSVTEINTTNLDSAADIELEPLNTTTNLHPTETVLMKRRNICHTMKRFLLEMYPLGLLLNWEYSLLLFASCMSLTMLVCQQIYMFVATESQGFSKEQSAAFLSILGSADMVGRLFSGQISDRKIVQPQYAMAFSCFVSGLAFSFIPLCVSLYSIVPVIIVFGCFLNVNLILLLPLMVELLGLKVFPKALSLLLACHGIICTIVPPLFGMIRDLMGTYNAIFPICGGLQVIGGCVLILECFVRHRQKRKSQLKQGLEKSEQGLCKVTLQESEKSGTSN